MDKSKEMTLEKLTIVSRDGEPRMLLTTEARSGMPVIFFLDDNGIRFQVGMASDGFPHITMKLANLEAAISLHAADNGNIAICVNYHNGNPALEIVVRPDSDIEISTGDRHGKQRRQVAQTEK